jgi:hypothetical protein
LASIQDAGLPGWQAVKIAADLIDNYSHLQMIFICKRKITNNFTVMLSGGKGLRQQHRSWRQQKRQIKAV